MKQTFHNKGSTVDQHGARQRTDLFEDFYELTGTGLQKFPIPEGRPLNLSRRLDGLARQLGEQRVEQILKRWASGENLESLVKEAETQTGLLVGQMIALQEELDWECYGHYGLLTESLCYTGEGIPQVELGQRAFEIVMARQMQKGELETTWFTRHGSTPITEIPSDWPDDYRELIQRRIDTIESNPQIGLIEKPEYKRRWNRESWADQQKAALRSWLLERLEQPQFRRGSDDDPQLISTFDMSHIAVVDKEFMEVAGLYTQRNDFDPGHLIAELVGAEAVPIIPVLRYKPSGLVKRQVWERTWDLQRQEDAQTDDEKKENPINIPVPPKYTSADFLSNDYWRLRGKLDVPKERWFSFPDSGTDSDSSLVVGWAGWNHLQQATAIISFFDEKKRVGWEPQKLVGVLCALQQLVPWLKQWHPEINSETGQSMGQAIENMIEQEGLEMGFTTVAIRNWTPPPKAPKPKVVKEKPPKVEKEKKPPTEKKPRKPRKKKETPPETE